MLRHLCSSYNTKYYMRQSSFTASNAVRLIHTPIAIFSKTVAELKMKFPNLQNGLRNILSNEMEMVVREEKFLKDEPDRLENALRRCKKLTGTLVTLKRLVYFQIIYTPRSNKF